MLIIILSLLQAPLSVNATENSYLDCSIHLPCRHDGYGNLNTCLDSSFTIINSVAEIKTKSLKNYTRISVIDDGSRISGTNRNHGLSIDAKTLTGYLVLDEDFDFRVSCVRYYSI